MDKVYIHNYIYQSLYLQHKYWNLSENEYVE